MPAKDGGFVQFVANALGMNWKYLHTENVFDEIAGLVPEFKGMSYESLGDLGQPVSDGRVKQAPKKPIYRRSVSIANRNKSKAWEA